MKVYKDVHKYIFNPGKHQHASDQLLIHLKTGQPQRSLRTPSAPE